MKSSLAIAALAALSNAVNLEQYIDLCPDAIQDAPIQLASHQSLLGKTQAQGFYVKNVGATDYEREALLERLEQLGSTQEACYQERLGSFQQKRLGSFEAEQTVMEKLAAIRDLQKLASLMELVGGQDDVQDQEDFTVGSQFRVGNTYRPSSQYGISSQEYRPASQYLVGSTIKAADDIYDIGYPMPGQAVSAPMIAVGNYPVGCAGQTVQTYENADPRVLWCGERNLTGNQTLKRTNIRHNYVHDINHEHNYHNRTRHAAKQFNTVEKDCSCNGVAKAAKYECPSDVALVGTLPGIRAPGIICDTPKPVTVGCACKKW